MAYKALYNKYRPSTFEEVAGQQAIVRTLRNAITNGKIAHAYLFCGPRGTGKTSMARLFAKALNCEEGVGHQCNRCSNCEAINTNSHPDVIEIDAASNNGVDQVRDLIDRVRYSPIKGKKKIYIIDEVHMMSQGAFNALLKTLEEPPEHVVFILATTEPHKVIPTILSRCQRYDFAKIDEKDIKERLEWVLKNEGIFYEEPALQDVVELADGGMRDALSILDQILAYGGNQLLEKDVLAVFGLTSLPEKINLLHLAATGQVTEALQKFETFAEGGVDIKRLCLSLLSILKDVLVYERTLNPNLLTTIKATHAQGLSLDINDKQCTEMINLLLKAQINFRSVSNIRSLFELTLLELCSVTGSGKEEAPKPEPKPAPKAEPKPVSKPESKPEPKPEPATEPEPIPLAVFEEKEEPAPMPAPEEQGVYTGTSVPDFLFQDEEVEEPKPTPKVEPKPAPKPEPKPEPKPVQSKLDVSFIREGRLASDGESNALPDETIVDVMVLGGKFKAERQNLAREWARLEDLRFDATVGEAAGLLFEGKPFCLCNEVLLVNFSFPRQKERANIKANQEVLSQLVQSIIGRRVFVYGIDHKDSNRCQNLYFSLKQIGKLPSADEIVLKLPKGE